MNIWGRKPRLNAAALWGNGRKPVLMQSEVQRKAVDSIIHLGDITAIDGRTAPPVDVVIGGSPCQDLSIAGRRAGLAGERSGLFMEQIRIIKEMR